MKLRAVFLDRDGVLNVSPRTRYVTRWEQFRFLPGIFLELRRLNERRLKVVVVSNQAAVGRGLMSRARLHQITRKMLRVVKEHGAAIDAVYYCLHAPQERCRCRKPALGMLRRAARRFGIDLKRSFVVGDHPTDLLMGDAAGAKTILVLTGKTKRSQVKRLSVSPDFIARDLSKAVSWILRGAG